MRFHDGEATVVKGTPYPERDKLNRDTIVRAYGLGNEINERPNMGIGGITPAQKLKMAA
jgi:hypothetical protein